MYDEGVASYSIVEHLSNARQIASEVVVAACFWYSLEDSLREHFVIFLQTRSFIAFGPFASNCVDAHAVAVVHSRSEMGVSFKDSNWLVVHLVNVEQIRFEVAVAGVPIYSPRLFGHCVIRAQIRSLLLVAGTSYSLALLHAGLTTLHWVSLVLVALRWI